MPRMVDQFLTDLKESQLNDFFELIKGSAAEAARLSYSGLWEIRTHNTVIYRHAAIYMMHQHGHDAKRIASSVGMKKATVLEIIRDYLSNLDSDDAKVMENYQAAIHAVTAAANRLRQGISKYV